MGNSANGHFEYVTKTNETAKKYCDECDRMLGLLQPLLGSMNRNIQAAKTGMDMVKKTLLKEEPVGDGDYYGAYVDSRDGYLGKYDGLDSNAQTTAGNLSTVIDQISSIKSYWEPQLYYTELEWVED